IQCIGVYAERAEVHMGLLWLKTLTLRGGQANVLGHVDPVLAMLSAGILDPSALVTHHMPPAPAPAAYAVFDPREALKAVLTPSPARGRPVLSRSSPATARRPCATGRTRARARRAACAAASARPRASVPAARAGRSSSRLRDRRRRRRRAPRSR